MFQYIADFFSTIPFFNSVAFGIIAMCIVGSSWSIIGLVMGDAPKKGIESSVVQLAGACFSATLSAIIMIATSAYSTASWQATLLCCLCYGANGAFNCIMLQFMSKAMQIGPNGIIWSIIQSGFVFTFIMGIVFFNVELTFMRGTGIVLILLALFVFGFGKDNNTKNSKWKLLAFTALFLTGIHQCLSVLPSYFEAVKNVSSIVRALSTSCGVLITALAWDLVQMDKAHFEKIKRNFKSMILWKYVGLLQFFSLICAYTLLYPGMDIMARAGMGGMCYPVMVGSCIISFTLASIFILKEKIRFLQLAGIAICIAGLILICTRN